MDLSTVTTKDLVEELSNRKDVQEICIMRSKECYLGDLDRYVDGPGILLFVQSEELVARHPFGVRRIHKANFRDD